MQSFESYDDEELWDDGAYSTPQDSRSSSLFRSFVGVLRSPFGRLPGGFIINLLPFLLLIALGSYIFVKISARIADPQATQAEVLSYDIAPQDEYLKQQVEAQIAPVLSRREVSSADKTYMRIFLRTTYVVKQGDSIARIAKHFGLKPETLRSINELKGEVLAGTTIEVPAVDGKLYTVKFGDTLSGIAVASGIRMKTIMDANDLKSDRIYEGQKLFLPSI